MNGRIVVLSGWRAYLLGALVLAALLLILITAGIVIFALAAVAAIAYVAYRALVALHLVRPLRRSAPDDRVIEGEYRVVEPPKDQ